MSKKLFGWLSVFFACMVITGCNLEGTVTDEGGQPLSGLTVLLSGGQNVSTVTDGSGHFLFENVDSGSYTVTPQSEVYDFQPETRLFTVARSDIDGLDFMGTATIRVYTISGCVTENGQGLEDVSLAFLNMVDGSVVNTVTNNQGTFTFFSVLEGDYQITPVKVGYLFDPNMIPVTVDGGDSTDVDFAAHLNVV